MTPRRQRRAHPSTSRLRRTTAVAALAAATAIAPGLAVGAAVAAPGGEGSISGTVRAGDGGPLGGVCVAVEDIEISEYHPTQTDGAGRWSVPGLADGSYLVSFSTCSGSDTWVVDEYYGDARYSSQAEAVPVAGGSAAVADAILTRAGKVTGVVSADDGGAPLESVCVRAEDPAENVVDSVYTDAAGSYELFVAPGTTVLAFAGCSSANVVAEYAKDQPDFESADPVTVAAGVVTTIDASLAAGGTIAGTVTTPETGSETGSDTCIDVFDTDSRALVGGGFTDSGSYVVRGLPAGSYQVQFTGCGTTNVVSEWWDDAALRQDSTPVVLGSGETRDDVSATLEQGGTVTGTVTRPDGSGADACVTAYDAVNLDEGDLLPLAYGNASPDDQPGSYTLTGLPDRDVKIEFVDCSGGNDDLQTEWSDDKPSFATADVVRVAPGTTQTGVDARLAVVPDDSGSGSGTPSSPPATSSAPAGPTPACSTASAVVASTAVAATTASTQVTRATKKLKKAKKSDAPAAKVKAAKKKVSKAKAASSAAQKALAAAQAARGAAC